MGGLLEIDIGKTDWAGREMTKVEIKTGTGIAPEHLAKILDPFFTQAKEWDWVSQMLRNLEAR